MSCTWFTTERVVDEGDKTIHIKAQGAKTIHRYKRTKI